jgi:hypothetical protein
MPNLFLLRRATHTKQKRERNLRWCYQKSYYVLYFSTLWSLVCGHWFAISSCASFVIQVREKSEKLIWSLLSVVVRKGFGAFFRWISYLRAESDAPCVLVDRYWRFPADTPSYLWLNVQREASICVFLPKSSLGHVPLSRRIPTKKETPELRCI